MSFFQLIEEMNAERVARDRSMETTRAGSRAKEDPRPYAPESALLLQPILFEQALRRRQPGPALRLVTG